MKKCPYCSELIQGEAIKCRYCGEWLKKEKVEAIDETEENEQNEKKAISEKKEIVIQSVEKECPYCRLINPKTATQCDCGHNFDSDLYEEVKISPKLKEVRPWVRYWARYFDYLLFGFVAGTVLVFIAPRVLEMNQLLLGILLIFVWMFVEAGFIYKWGTTPGKWLLRTSVVDSSGQKLTYSRALSRGFSVWCKGLGLGIPIVMIVTMLIEHGKLTKEGATSWDRAGELIVSHEKVGWKRSLIFALFFMGFLMLSYYGTYYEDLSSISNPFSEYSSSINTRNWERYYLGTSNLSIEAPGNFNPYNLELSEDEKNMISYNESYSYSSKIFQIITSYIKYPDWIIPEVNAAEKGAIESMEMTNGVLDLEYKTEPISISGIFGRLSKGSYKEDNTQWGFKQVILMKDQKMWQVIVVYAVDLVDEIASEKVIKSIVIDSYLF